MDRPLNSDQLGKKGELHFPGLCVDDGLIPNPSSWDRKGWDFIVDWPFEKESCGYDTRPSPRSCQVQVKTVWDDTDEVVLRLSSIEHLAKDVKPAFIVVLRVMPDQTFAESRIAHVDEDLLGHILKALRIAEIDGEKPNSVKISLSLAKWFEPLSAAKGALRQAFEAAIGPAMDSYVERKQRSLRELGFDQGHLTFHTTLRASSMDDITDAFLGLAPIEAINTTGTETRFGLPLPIPELKADKSTLKFEPRANDTCKIVVRAGNPDREFVFKAEMFSLPPQLRANHIKVLIRNELFSLVLRIEELKPGHNNFKMNLTIDRDSIRKLRLRATDWRDFYGFLDALARARLNIQIKPRKMPQPIGGQIEIDREPLHDESEYAYAARLTSIAADAFERAAWPGAKLKIEEIGDAGRELIVLERLIEKPDELTPLTFSTDKEALLGGETIDLLYFNYILFGEHALAFGASCVVSATVDIDAAHWKSTAVRLRDIARIKARPADFNRFIARVERSSGIGSRFVANIMPVRNAKR